MKRARATGRVSKKKRVKVPQVMVPVPRVVVAPVGEKKFFDTVRASFTPATTGTIANLSLNLIPQGVTESERVGRKCTIKNVTIRGQVLMNTTATAANTATIVRIIVYLDKQANGQTAAVTDILDSATEFSFNNMSNKGRFITLGQERIALSCPSGSGRGSTDTLSYGENVAAYFFNKEVNIPVEFSTGGTGAITEIRSNNIGVLAIQGSQALANMEYISRVRFTDN